jgi:peroxiredoxin Q/BCP
MLGCLGAAGALEVGQPAPSLKLPDQHGKPRDVADSYGRWVALAFYPKDDTPGCTVEAKGFTAELDALAKAGIDVFGISVQDVASKEAFCGKYGLKHALLSDTDKSVSLAYGTLNARGMADRVTVILDPARTVRVIDRQVKVQTHAQDVLKTVQGLRAADAGKELAKLRAEPVSAPGGLAFRLPERWIVKVAGVFESPEDQALSLRFAQAPADNELSTETVCTSCCGAMLPKIKEKVTVAGKDAVRVERLSEDEGSYTAELYWSDGKEIGSLALTGPSAKAAGIARLLAAIASTARSGVG